MLVVAGWLVVLVLVLAGMSTLGRPRATAEALRVFGLPEPVARALAPWVAVDQIVIAVLLLIPRASRVGSIIATVLFALLTLAVALALLRGKRPSYNGFGQLRAAPIGWTLAARNALLTACAGMLITSDGQLLENTAKLGSNLDTTMTAWLLLGPLALVQGWLIVHLVSRQGRLLRQVERLEQRFDDSGLAAQHQLAPSTMLEVGAPAPAFSGVAMSGETVTLEGLVNGRRPMLVVFVSPQCGACKTLMADLLAWRTATRPRERLVVIASGTVEANLGQLGELPGSTTVLQKHMEISTLFGVAETPSALRLDSAGRVESPLAQGLDAIMELARSHAAQEPEFRAISSSRRKLSVSENAR